MLELFTSMNGVDPGRGQGYLRQVFPLQFPWTPGGDVSGRVAVVGEGVANFKVGMKSLATREKRVPTLNLCW